MEAGEIKPVGKSQTDIGTALILLGISYAISLEKILSYISLVFAMVGVIVLLYRRHSLSISQGRFLYTSVIVFILSIVSAGVILIVEIISLAGSLVRAGYSGGNLPGWAVSQIVYSGIAIGAALAVVSGLCYLFVTYPMAMGNLKRVLIAGFLISIGLKGVQLYMLSSSLLSSSISLSSGLGFLRFDPTQMPYVLFSIASALVFGIPMIYLGLQVRSGKFRPLPTDEFEMF